MAQINININLDRLSVPTLASMVEDLNNVVQSLIEERRKAWDELDQANNQIAVLEKEIGMLMDTRKK